MYVYSGKPDTSKRAFSILYLMFTLKPLNYDHINLMFIHLPFLTRNGIDVYVNRVYQSLTLSPNRTI